MTGYREQSLSGIRSQASVFMREVYTWMAAGLGITAVAAWQTSSSPALLQFFFGSTLMVVLMIALLFGLVIAINAMISRISSGAATGLFLLYAAVMGIFLGPTVLAYGHASVAKAFVVTAGMFGGMSIYGMVTKRDLTGMGSFLSMGLWGLILAMIVNIFLASPAVDFAVSVIGVIVFTGLTAYDTQKIYAMGVSAPYDDGTAVRRGAILGALELYLDFVNLFLMLLRLFGDRR